MLNVFWSIPPVDTPNPTNESNQNFSMKFLPLKFDVAMRSDLFYDMNHELGREFHQQLGVTQFHWNDHEPILDWWLNTELENKKKLVEKKLTEHS